MDKRINREEIFWISTAALELRTECMIDCLYNYYGILLFFVKKCKPEYDVQDLRTRF